MLLSHSPRLINSRTHNGRTVLHCAVSGSKDSDCARTVNVESATDVLDFCCVIHGLLYHCPSHLRTPDSCGTLPVFDALRRGHVRIATHLLDYAQTREQLLAEDKLGQQAIHVAAESGQVVHISVHTFSSPMGEFFCYSTVQWVVCTTLVSCFASFFGR